MPTAAAIATELRKLADVFDHSADKQVIRPEFVFYCFSNKQALIDAVSIMPRPLKKEWPDGDGQYDSVNVGFENEAIKVRAQAWRSAVCKVVKPARAAQYECEPLLSEQEESAITA